LELRLVKNKFLEEEMKKLLAILSITALALVITACGDTQDTTPTQGTTGQQQQTQQQQGQESGGAQNADANQGTGGQSSDQQADTPEQNRNVALFNEFVAEYARVNPGRTQGISNGVAYFNNRHGNFFLLDINTGQVLLHSRRNFSQTYSFDDANRLLSLENFTYWNGHIYAAASSLGNPSSTLRFDLQGNLIDEFLGYFARLQNGNILVGIATADGGNVSHTAVISASDFSVIQSPLILTRDVGHGRTEEVSLELYNIRGRILTPNKLYFHTHLGSDWYSIDLLTGESQRADYLTGAEDASTRARYGLGISAIYGSFARMRDGFVCLETGERLVVERFRDATFTGTNIFWASGHEVMRYNPATMEFDVVFVAPNHNTHFAVLSDEYLIVHDHIGMFLYRFVDGDVNGEFVREIILP